MNFFVTGGAGFIGSTFCDTALEKGHSVIAFDSFETGDELFLEHAKSHPKFKLILGTLLPVNSLTNKATSFMLKYLCVKK